MSEKKDKRARDKKGRFLPTHSGFAVRRPLKIRKELTIFREQYVKELAGSEDTLTAAQRTLLDRATSILGVCRCIEHYIHEVGAMQKDKLTPVLANNYITYVNSLKRILETLGIEKKVHDETPSLVEVIKDIESKKESTEAE